MDRLKECILCPRECGADRLNGQIGFCGGGRSVRIARAGLHYWEEPCISGKNGSGAVFFSGCTMKCVFCQNYEISAKNYGCDISERELADIFLSLKRQGAENINLVTPTHYIPQIITALDMAKTDGLDIPVVYNSGGYEKAETIKMLDGYIDIYMPDFKYYSDDIEKKYSFAANYRETAKSAFNEMYKQTGASVMSKDGIMLRGMIIRHLMLPGRLNDTVRIINYVNKTFGNKVYFSLMSQYTPPQRLINDENLKEKIDMRSYHAAVGLCERLGMENVFIQSAESADECFIPEFFSEKCNICKET